MAVEWGSPTTQYDESAIVRIFATKTGETPINLQGGVSMLDGLQAAADSMQSLYDLLNGAGWTVQITILGMSYADLVVTE